MIFHDLRIIPAMMQKVNTFFSLFLFFLFLPKAAFSLFLFFLFAPDQLFFP